ncbi:MAG TPA: mechanosensitive ion channel domain-containing protein [Longimicrobiales bacterium]|nr:mechanosensitive ion channel domain-containing protein [Longimicrobiales bacterium]
MRPSLLAVALAAGFIAILLARVTPYIGSPAARRFIIRRALPFAEIVFALAATLYAMTRLFGAQPPETRIAMAIVIGAIAWALHALIADVVSGWVVRMEGGVEPGRWVRLPGLVDGRVRHVGFRSVLIETATGDQVRVPLRDVAVRPVTTADTAAGARAHTFTIEIPRTRPLAPLLTEIPAAALTSPWSSTVRLPEIDVRSETDTHYIIEVTAWALDPTFAPEIEAAVRQAINR